MTFTFETARGMLREAGIVEGAKTDPLAIFAESGLKKIEGIDGIDEEKYGKVIDILKIGDELGELVSNTLLEPTVKESYISDIAELKDSLSDTKTFYEISGDDRFFIGDMRRLWRWVTRVKEGTLGERFDKSWQGLGKTLDGVVENIKAQEKVCDLYQGYTEEKKRALRMVTEIKEAYHDNQVQVANQRLADAVAKYEEMSGKLESGSAELQDYEVARDKAQRIQQAVDKQYNFFDKLQSAVSNSITLGKGLQMNLEQNITADEGLREKAALIMATNQDVYNMIRVSYTAMQSTKLATKGVDMMEEGINEAIDMAAELGLETKKAAAVTAERDIIKPEALAKLYGAIVEYEQFAATEIPKLRAERKANYDGNIAMREQALQDIAQLRLEYGGKQAA